MGRTRGKEKTHQAARHLIEFMQLVPHSFHVAKPIQKHIKTFYLMPYEFHKSDFLELNWTFL